jgi:hypothetical protein
MAIGCIADWQLAVRFAATFSLALRRASGTAVKWRQAQNPRSMNK